MGNYNPHTPIILGEEWVPLRDPGFKPDNVTEYGTTIHIDNAQTAVTGYFFIEENVPNTMHGVVDLISVYPAGTENDTGPIQQVVIPVSAIGTTGTGIAGTLVNIQNPSDSDYITFTMGQPTTQMLGLNFDTGTYQGALQNKRILNVELLLQVAGTPENISPAFGSSNTATVGLMRWTGGAVAQTLASALQGALLTTQVTELQAISLGDVNLHWNSAVIFPTIELKAYPWRWEELNQLAATASGSTRLIIRISFFNPNGTGTVQIGYAALRVTYCEEKRVLYGGWPAHPSIGFNNYTPGPTAVQLLNTAFTTPSALSAGDYTVTLSHRLYGDSSAYAYARTAPLMYGITEYVGVEQQRGRLVRQSLTVGDTFTVDDSPFLPQVTLHTTSGIVTGSHAYGTVIEAPVYGSITAAQVVTNLGNTGGTYPSVRFYARHFGALNPLRLSSSTFSVDITPGELDALPEIADGWREVTLQFTTAPTGAQVGATWTFSATSESAGTRWEVIGVNGTSPAAPQNIGPATYQAPTGSTQTLTWKSPTITGTAADSTSDVVLMFSQMPPSVTGFAVTQDTLELTTINDECGVSSACLPTGIYCNQLSWDAGVTFDSYSVDSASTWPNADTGESWTTVTLSAGSSISVSGGAGNVYIGTAGSASNIFTIPGFSSDSALTTRVYIPAHATDAALFVQPLLRFTDVNNYYSLQVVLNSDLTTLVRFEKNVAGVSDSSFAPTVSIEDVAENWLNIEFAVIGSNLMARVWLDGDERPTSWTLTAINTELTTGATGGIRVGAAGGNTNAPIIIKVDNFTLIPGSIYGGQLEIQRQDDDDEDWQDILLTEDLSTFMMCDYEARVGVLSSYRVRTVNVSGFTGAWVTGSGTIPTPGVVVPDTDTTVLIFTSNIAPDGSLAYPMTWDGQVIESFAFPEASEQTFQRLYGRDFQVAFRPLERGGETFDRVMLIQAASVTPVRLANMTSLRDLAWEDLPYVCVRDELGNRWFANVLVPSGTVQNKRRIYLAQVRVTSVTSTPAPVGQWP